MAIDERKEKARELFENSAIQLKQISEQLNIDSALLSRWKKKYKWVKKEECLKEYKSTLGGRTYHHDINDPDIQKIKKLYETTSIPVIKMAEQMNLSITQVWSRIHKYNFIRPSKLQHEMNITRGIQMYANLTATQKEYRLQQVVKWNKENGWKSLSEEKQHEIINKLNDGRRKYFAVPTNTAQMVIKGHNTKKNNGSYGKSALEETLYKYLSLIAANIERQVYIEGMSFDFRVNSTLVELNGLYYHNFRPFNNIDKHIKEFDNMIDKGGTSETIAKTWRYRDTKKLQYCTDNNLNYICIYFDDSTRNLPYEYCAYKNVLSNIFNNKKLVYGYLTSKILSNKGQTILLYDTIINELLAMNKEI